MLGGTRARELERVAHDALDPWPSETHRHLGDLVLTASGDPSGLAVHVLGVLADHHQVDVLRALALQWHEAVVIRDDGTEVHEEVEATAHAEDDVPLDDPARSARIADRAEQDGVERTESVDVFRCDPAAGLYITRRRPWQFLAHSGKVEAPLGCVQDAERGAGHLGADAIAADDGESERATHAASAIVAEPLTWRRRRINFNADDLSLLRHGHARSPLQLRLCDGQPRFGRRQLARIPVRSDPLQASQNGRPFDFPGR